MTSFGTVGEDDDAAWLGGWAEPTHVVMEHIAGYRRDFAAHPARLIVLRNFLHGDIAERVSAFLEREAEWGRAETQDRFFKFSETSGVGPEFRLGTNVVAYLKVLKALEDDRFVRFAEAISGLRLGSPHLNVHRMTAGDFLAPHTDAQDDRRLAFVLFLSRGWDPALGGTLHLTDAGGGESAIEPAFNTLVLFDVRAHGEHWVTPIQPAAGDRGRFTIGGWIEDRLVR